MSLETSRLRFTGVNLVNGAYELQTERQTMLSEILFIPGIAVDPITEINRMLFLQGQQGGFWCPSLTPSLISGSTFGTGVETLPDLSPTNNPFSQANSGNRAAWFREPKRGRVNFSIHTEDITQTNWSVLNVIKSSATVLAESANNADHIMFDTQSVVSGEACTVSASMRKNSAVDIIQLSFRGGGHGTEIFANFNINTGVVTRQDGGTATIVPESGGFFRCTFTANAIATASNAGLVVAFVNNNPTATKAPVYLGSNASTIEITRLQFEKSSPTNYQRVTTAFDVSEVGQKDCFGVRFDGTDDWYERAIDFSGTDKVTLFVAMRRGSVAARGTVLELTSSIASNNGAFHLTAPNAASATFGFESKGTTLRDAVITQAMSNPRIITAIGDIAGDLASIQVDNGTPTTNTGDQGSGNYANSILYLGRRGGSSLSLNGDIYAVIVAGGLYSAATRQRVRTILSSITPTVNL
jgi:hypothetical protein